MAHNSYTPEGSGQWAADQIRAQRAIDSFARAKAAKENPSAQPIPRGQMTANSLERAPAWANPGDPFHNIAGNPHLVIDPYKAAHAAAAPAPIAPATQPATQTAASPVSVAPGFATAQQAAGRSVPMMSPYGTIESHFTPTKPAESFGPPALSHAPTPTPNAPFNQQAAHAALFQNPAARAIWQPGSPENQAFVAHAQQNGVQSAYQNADKILASVQHPAASPTPSTAAPPTAPIQKPLDATATPPAQMAGAATGINPKLGWLSEAVKNAKPTVSAF